MLYSVTWLLVNSQVFASLNISMMQRWMSYGRLKMLLLCAHICTSTFRMSKWSTCDFCHFFFFLQSIWCTAYPPALQCCISLNDHVTCLYLLLSYLCHLLYNHAEHKAKSPTTTTSAWHIPWSQVCSQETASWSILVGTNYNWNLIWTFLSH